MATLSNFSSTNTTNKILQNATMEVMEKETAAGSVQLQFFFHCGHHNYQRHRLSLHRSVKRVGHYGGKEATKPTEQHKHPACLFSGN